MNTRSLLRKARGASNWITSRFTSRCAVLLYHRVDEDNIDPYRLCVRPDNFASHMELLSRTGRALSLPDLETAVRGGRIPSGKVCVTFDDGYLDNLEIALPILEKFQIPATIFVVSGTMGKPFWWDRLTRIVFQSGSSREVSEILGLPHPAPTNLPGCLQKLEERFRSMPERKRHAKLDEASRAQNHHSLPLPRSMNREELATLSRHPLITLGAHSVSHTRLASLDANLQRAEISESIAHLSEALDIDIHSFSYPFGIKGRDFNTDTQQAVRGCGVELAFAADRNVVTRHSDPYALPRIWINDWPAATFRRNLSLWL